MVTSSSDELPDYVRGIVAVLSQLPGAALLADASGQVIYGNSGYLGTSGGKEGAPDRVPCDILDDMMGTDQPGYHSLTLPSGRRTGVACLRLGGGDMPGPFLMLREDARQQVVAKFATAQEGLLKSREERDRARAEEKRLRAEADHWRLVSMSDSLTGLYNANGFRDRARAAMASHEVGALVYADLNGFKAINDTLGHGAGDNLLQDIGQSLQAAIRGGDLAGRLGGDEFAIYLPNCPSDELPKVVDRLRKAMTRRIPVRRGADEPAMILTVTAAVGAAIYPEDRATLDDLLHLADARMYAEKSGAAAMRG